MSVSHYPALQLPGAILQQLLRQQEATLSFFAYSTPSLGNTNSGETHE